VRTLIDLDAPMGQRLEVIHDSKHEGKLLIEALQAEASCAAYREALKNVMRSKPSARAKIAREAVYGKSIKPRGKTMLKVFKAAVQVWWFSRKGTDKEFLKALKCLECAMENFELKGPSVRKWLKKKELVNG
jgi:hypothetical protein